MGLLSAITGFNPYAAVAGGVAVLAVVGGFVYDDRMIHHYHTQYDQTVLDDTKIMTSLRYQIADLVNTQRDQTIKTTEVITKVVKTPPEIVTVTKTIHDAPLPADCTTPALDTLRNNT